MWYLTIYIPAFPGMAVVKNLPANAGDRGLIPGSGRSPEEDMATHSSILVWRFLWTRSLMGCSPWGCKESDKTETLNNNNKQQTIYTGQQIDGYSLFNYVLMGRIK